MGSVSAVLLAPRPQCQQASPHSIRPSSPTNLQGNGLVIASFEELIALHRAVSVTITRCHNSMPSQNHTITSAHGCQRLACHCSSAALKALGSVKQHAVIITPQPAHMPRRSACLCSSAALEHTWVNMSMSVIAQHSAHIMEQLPSEGSRIALNNVMNR